MHTSLRLVFLLLSPLAATHATHPPTGRSIPSHTHQRQPFAPCPHLSTTEHLCMHLGPVSISCLCTRPAFLQPPHSHISPDCVPSSADEMTENIHPQPPPSDARLATAEDETNVVPTMATATATDTAPSSSLLDSAALPSTSQLAVPSSADDATDRPSTPTPLTLRPAIPLHPGSLEDMSPFMTEPNKEVSESPITYKPTMDAPVLEHHDTRPRSATDATVSPRRVQQASLSPRARSRTVGANSLRGSADDDLPTMGSVSASF